ncbi:MULTISPECIES: polyprenyl synthetase family protein [unclassified Frondihabitans]|uniref:polyprenyl synthetase family protein n=1 Tax=unclassified Frondihabitans TaxID=2626248 RepID=UPI000700690E|nr:MULTISPECIES: polyprenyl synthetase family protein [unclassified Frondihabitans]KQQ28180.1 geranylgeranyl pyrophosphate synthase [Frondihabitans sp. Leaf304]RPE78880.1 heptaprenyl diphosphate synthase [Frondihabitans sp. PhB153]RPF09161.1 heptaprenyl diphosphate synthase [Frondihabitans sp. PhB161]
MKPSAPAARRTAGLSSSLGLAEKLFSSASERRFVAAIDAGLERVEEGLLVEMAFGDDLADVTSRYLLAAGGKRIRPTLALLISQLGDGATDSVVSAAQAVEITHLASLYHDDVMDEATMRRGVPSAQSRWGNNVAILTGDLLFARASTIVADLGEEAIRLQAQTFERLCLGQLHETIGPRVDDDPVAHYLDVLSDKTGSLISMAAKVGVLFSNAPREYLGPVSDFGEKIGVAFQLIDDVIDLSPQAETTGKRAGTDLLAGVETLPLMYLRVEAQTDIDSSALLSEIEANVKATTAGGAVSEADLADTVRQLREHDVTRRTHDEAKRWADEAVAALAPLPEGPVKKALTRFAQRVVERTA